MLETAWKTFDSLCEVIAKEAGVPNNDWGELTFKIIKHQGKASHIEVVGVGKLRPTRK